MWLLEKQRNSLPTCLSTASDSEDCWGMETEYGPLRASPSRAQQHVRVATLIWSNLLLSRFRGQPIPDAPSQAPRRPTPLPWLRTRTCAMSWRRCSGELTSWLMRWQNPAPGSKQEMGSHVVCFSEAEVGKELLVFQKRKRWFPIYLRPLQTGMGWL